MDGYIVYYLNRVVCKNKDSDDVEVLMFFEFDISDVNKNIEDIKDYFYL